MHADNPLRTPKNIRPGCPAPVQRRRSVFPTVLHPGDKPRDLSPRLCASARCRWASASRCSASPSPARARSSASPAHVRRAQPARRPKIAPTRPPIVVGLPRDVLALAPAYGKDGTGHRRLTGPFWRSAARPSASVRRRCALLFLTVVARTGGLRPCCRCRRRR